MRARCGVWWVVWCSRQVCVCSVVFRTVHRGSMAAVERQPVLRHNGRRQWVMSGTRLAHHACVQPTRWHEWLRLLVNRVQNTNDRLFATVRCAALRQSHRRGAVWSRLASGG